MSQPRGPQHQQHPADPTARHIGQGDQRRGVDDALISHPWPRGPTLRHRPGKGSPRHDPRHRRRPVAIGAQAVRPVPGSAPFSHTLHRRGDAHLMWGRPRVFMQRRKRALGDVDPGGYFLERLVHRMRRAADALCAGIRQVDRDGRRLRLPWSGARQGLHWPNDRGAEPSRRNGAQNRARGVGRLPREVTFRISGLLRRARNGQRAGADRATPPASSGSASSLVAAQAFRRAALAAD